MKNKLIIDGKEIDLPQELVDEIKVELNKKRRINGFVFFVIPDDYNFEMIKIFDENGDSYKNIDEFFYCSENIINFFILEFPKLIANKNLYKIELSGVKNNNLEDFYCTLMNNYDEFNLEIIEKEAAFFKLKLEYKKLNN